MILSPLSIEKISPFFDILCSYLRCAMTHIDTYIHEDSVFFFDVLVDNAPDLVALNLHKIFPSFLDMISKLKVDSKPGRTLLLNLGSKMTSVKWRTKVLLRLLKFLSILNNIESQAKGFGEFQTDSYNINSIEDNMKNHIDSKTVVFNKNKRNYFPLYRKINISKLSYFSKDKITQEENSYEQLKSYTEVLLPLLFDTWLEVKPARSVDKKNIESMLSEEAVVILKLVLEIFLLIWNLLKMTNENTHYVELREWFVVKHQKVFIHQMSNSFPYSQTAIRIKKKDQVSEQNTSGEKCLEENLMICHIYAILHYKLSSESQRKEAGRIMNYVKWSCDNISSKNIPCQLQLVSFFNCILKNENWTQLNEMVPLLDKIIMVYTNDNNSQFKEQLFTSLCSILLNNTQMFLQQTSCFQYWLSNLPNAISEESSISEKKFDVIMKLAIQNNKLFNASIKSKLKFIVENLPKITITGAVDKNEAKKKIVNLLYWIDCWDLNSLIAIQEQLETQSYDFEIKEYLVSILGIKTHGLFSP